MGIDKLVNPWWQDVLENGPSSPYSTYFDIDWDPVKPELKDKVLLPILGDLYGIVLENQEMVLTYENGGFFIRYHDHRLPVAPKPWAMILSHRLEDLIQQAGATDPHVQELQSIITALGHLPSRSERDPARMEERYREKAIIKKRLAALIGESRLVARFIEENVGLFNGTKGEPRSFELLEGLLADQAYRPAYWRVASEEINYRRFFDINELAAIRMEEPAVFRECHALIFRLLKEGAVKGLRIDHVDGLYNPGDYLHQVQAWARAELFPPGKDRDADDRPLFLLVEKILGKDEPIPENWPVHGTTGYEFLNMVNGLFVDTANVRAFDAIYARFIRDRLSYDDLAYEKKKLIMRASMASEINVLGHQLNRISERDRHSRDFTLNSLTHAIREIIACFPVYRTYVTEGPEDVTERDQDYIRQAVAKAKQKNPALSGLVFDFVEGLLLKRPDEQARQDRQERLRFVMKFQQTTSPVMAKGIEDTAFYIYNRLISLNEVGGDPEDFGTALAAFHERMRERQARWPYALSATTTHDTKRSEDVRARINVLSEIPQDWKAHVFRWSKLNRKHATVLGGHPAPDRNEEYFLYQTLIGAWPLRPLDDDWYSSFCDRIQQHMAKAIKEAKTHTSWINPQREYDDAVRHFIEAILDRTGPNPFLADFLPFQERVAQYGMWNSLAQLVLKTACPGIPDFYQGTDLWDLSLVDPDNRRPVDFAGLAGLLAELQHLRAGAGTDRRSCVRDLLESRADGLIKLYVTMVGLTFRRDHAELFQEGDYVPLESQGCERDHLCAFARIQGTHAVAAVVPRLMARLIPDAKTPPLGEDVWGDTWVTVPSWRPRSQYRNLFTGEVLTSRSDGNRQVLPAAEIFSVCPVALLERIQ
jgi:(1->4)-alpha-D-glucan 1-alpha-D-glucosylmutase